MTESEAILNVQKRAIFNNFCVKIARFSYLPHNLPHNPPHNLLRGNEKYTKIHDLLPFMHKIVYNGWG
jgi:hypothetical protein